MSDPAPKFFYSPTELPHLYTWIDSFAHQWLAEVGIFSQKDFDWWSKDRAIVVCSIYPNSLILLENVHIGWRVNLHILAADKTFFKQHSLHQQFLQFLNKQYQFHRIEIWVSPTAGHTIRKLLQGLDFSRDAVLKSAWKNYAQTPPVLQDIEIWAKVT
jgi:hypothetical protein